MRIPPNSDQYLIPKTHQLGGVGKRYSRSQCNKGGHVQDVFNRGYFGAVREGYPSLAPQVESLLFQISLQTIQEGDYTQEVYKDQKTTPLCCLLVWKVPQEAIEYLRQTLRWGNQEILGDHTWGHEIN